jgi:hypothetical protein
MKLISLFVLGVLAVAMSASAQAQTTDPIAKETTDPIAKALLAAPNAAMAKDATVIKWNSDFTYETLKKGTSRMVCYDLSGWPGERGPWSVECTSSEANLPRIAQNRKFAAMGGGDPKKTEELVAAAAKDGTRIMSEVGSIWFNLFGKNEATATRHWFIAMPNLRGNQVGLPEVRDAGGAWLMLAGTPEAHIMLPTGPLGTGPAGPGPITQPGR